jgi:hypothetical protein
MKSGLVVMMHNAPHQFGLENVFKSAQEAEDFIMNHAGNKQASKHPILLILRSSSL